MATAPIVRITAAGVPSVVGQYLAKASTIVPDGFAVVCKQQRWPVLETCVSECVEPSRARPRLALTSVLCAGRWKRLSDLEKPWFEADNGAYIYFNKGDGQWWIDEPNGSGVYVSGRATSLPPADGWKPIGSSPSPLPTVIAQ